MGLNSMEGAWNRDRWDARDGMQPEAILALDARLSTTPWVAGLKDSANSDLKSRSMFRPRASARHAERRTERNCVHNNWRHACRTALSGREKRAHRDCMVANDLTEQ